MSARPRRYDGAFRPTRNYEMGCTEDGWQVHGAEGRVRRPSSAGLGNGVAIVCGRPADRHEHDGVRGKDVRKHPFRDGVALKETLIALILGRVDASLPVTHTVTMRKEDSGGRDVLTIAWS